MANSAVIDAPQRTATSPLFPPRTPSGLLLRLRTWIRRPWLDGAIARGLHRPGDRAFALRCAQLADRRQRTRLAVELEEVLTTASRPELPSSAAPVDLDAVDLARPILTELVLSLRSSEEVEARGVALGWRLLTDPASPIYAPPLGSASAGDRLWCASVSVLLALQPLAGGLSAPLS